jgi:dipicolinate synthase subunit A
MEIVEMDDIAILNSIPTAEGAIQIAMEETDITIHGSKTCVIGFGRVGITMARTLKALGSEVTIVARNPGQLARAYEMGCHRAGYDDLHEIMNHTNIVFNTVPTMVLDSNILKYANPDVLIIDLATQPGGTDFEAANTFGLKAILAPGLPGKVAPVYAGKILAEVIPRLIMTQHGKSQKDLLYG